jgi:hypothetical protein
VEGGLLALRITWRMDDGRWDAVDGPLRAGAGVRSASGPVRVCSRR